MSDLPTSPFVFLSYSRSDLEFALRLKNDLQKRGIDVWMDQEDIQPATPIYTYSYSLLLYCAFHCLSKCAQFLLCARRTRCCRDVQRPVFPVWAAGALWIESVPLGMGSIQCIDARKASYEAVLRHVPRR
jgi:hypothetical protein